MINLPDHPDKFSINWLAEKIGCGSETLKNFSYTPIGTGQVGDSYRIALEWDGVEGPATVIAKCSASNLTSRQTAKNMNLYEIEARWYLDYASDVPVRVPNTYYVGINNEDKGNFVMLMEDLAPAKQISQIDGCNFDNVKLVLDEAALLHGSCWNNKNLSKIKWLNYGKGRKEYIKQLLLKVYPEWCSRYKNRIDKSIIEMGRSLIDKYESYLKIEETPIVLAHGDLRLDNVMFHDSKGRAIILDWQTLNAGSPMSDISYCISTSFCNRHDRSLHEESLVNSYLKKLSLPENMYSQDSAWRDYRRFAFSGFLMGVLSSMLVERTDRGDEMFAVMAERSGYQALDLKSLSLI